MRFPPTTPPNGGAPPKGSAAGPSTPASGRPRHTPRPFPRTRSAGLTLLEVILAIAVAAFVLASAATYVVSISNIWADREERNFFQDHVDGVTEFLKASFANAGTEIAIESQENDNDDNDDNGDEGDEGDEGDDGDDDGDGERGNRTADADGSGSGGLLRVADDPVGWARPPGASDFQDPLLNFKLSTSPPLLVSEGDLPALGVDCFLRFERDEGLSLLWHSILQEEVEDERDLQRTPLSDLVADIRYIYWDERFEQWEEETEPKEGDGQDQFLLPRYLKLVFEYEGAATERILAIPVPSKSALIF